jgi:ComF family protein
MSRAAGMLHIAPALLRGYAAGLGRAALDFLLPPHCPGCDMQVPIQGTFCPACFKALNFITAPLCKSCGLPFSSAAHCGSAAICFTCTAQPPAWREARAALVYDDAARRLILPFKHAERPDVAQVLARHMTRAGRQLLARADVLVPVPLHRWRLFARGFNQAAHLAQAVSQQSGVPAVVDGLRRVRRTPALGPLSATERAQVLQGAFMSNRRRADLLAGKRVLLIDDVMTSGATANTCAIVLAQAGCCAVDVLVAARVPDPRRL